MGILDNSTGGAPVSLGTQVFDIKDNGTIVVIGDVVTDSRIGSGYSLPVTSVIARGTDRYHGVSGSVMTIEKFYDPGKALFLDVVFNTIYANGSKRLEFLFFLLYKDFDVVLDLQSICCHVPYT